MMISTQKNDDQVLGFTDQNLFFYWPAHQSHHCGSVLVIDKKYLTVGNGLFLALKTKFQPITQLNFENKSAQILMKPSPVAWKWLRVGQIWSQIKKLVFLKIGEGSTPSVKPKTSSQNVHLGVLFIFILCFCTAQPPIWSQDGHFQATGDGFIKI